MKLRYFLLIIGILTMIAGLIELHANKLNNAQALLVIAILVLVLSGTVNRNFYIKSGY